MEITVTVKTEKEANITDEVVRMVYVTPDYGKFTLLKTNRNVKVTHVNSLKKAMLEKDLGADVPILVDEDFNVRDGQHRLTARIALGLPIYYTVATIVDTNDVCGLNSIDQKWSIDDLVRSYSAHGNEEYTKLIKFSEKHKGLTINKAILLLGRQKQASVRRGEFVFPTDETIDTDIDNIIRLNKHFNTTFTAVLTNVYHNYLKHTEGYDHEYMLDQLSRQGKNYVMSKVDEVAEHFTKIYNYGRTKKNYTYFYKAKK